jgi:hypothetical protein
MTKMPTTDVVRMESERRHRMAQRRDVNKEKKKCATHQHFP